MEKINYSISRREFLKNVGFVGIASVIVPQFLFSRCGKYSKPKINLEVIVDKIENDFISKNYYEHKEKSVLNQSLMLVKKVYESLGENDGFSGIEINLDYKEKNFSKGKSFKLHYPSPASYSIALIQMKKEPISSYLSVLKDKTKAGMAMQEYRYAFIFPSGFGGIFGSNIDDYIQRGKKTICHELGHLLGLSHDNQGLTFMTQGYWGYLGAKYNSEQIKKIYEYFQKE